MSDSSSFVSFDDAFSLLPRNPVIVTSMAAAEPQGFFSRLHEHLPRLGRVIVHCANPNFDYPCFEVAATLGGRVEFRTLFLTSAVRGRVRRAQVQYVPQHLSQWSRNILARGGVDAFWGSCAALGGNGSVNLGLGACYETEIIKKARLVLLEVNRNMPPTCGATTLDASRVSAFIDNSFPLPTLSEFKPTDIDVRVAENVARLVPDGATLQLGIGAIPNAIGGFLKARRHLGIHTELMTDAVVDLFESGAVDGSRKTLFPGLIVGSFVLGHERLYDFVRNNPLVELHPSSFVNDPEVIRANPLMHSINTCIEIDLTGQVCSESLGHEEISGVGGAADTHVGAQRSAGGRGILAFASRTAHGASKIVFELKPGAKVSVGRNDVDTIVTEYGIAELRGRSVAERVLALVNVAHPDDREVLWENAVKVGYVSGMGHFSTSL